jgi:hypothetical protein
MERGSGGEVPRYRDIGSGAGGVPDPSAPVMPVEREAGRGMGAELGGDDPPVFPRDTGAGAVGGVKSGSGV